MRNQRPRESTKTGVLSRSTHVYTKQMHQAILVTYACRIAETSSTCKNPVRTASAGVDNPQTRGISLQDSLNRHASLRGPELSEILVGESREVAPVGTHRLSAVYYKCKHVNSSYTQPVSPSIRIVQKQLPWLISENYHSIQIKDSCYLPPHTRHFPKG